MTDARMAELRDNYLRVMEKIEAAKSRRAAGVGGEVSLLAATKTVPAEEVRFLVEQCGLKLCGENHAQEFVAKFDEVKAAGGEMDFIGHLQTNKVKYLVGNARLIHSVDSIKLAAEIDRLAQKRGVIQDILVEVNIGNEESKSGIAPEETADFVDSLGRFECINLRGMMTMAPKCEKSSEFRKYFTESYRLFLDIFAKKSHNIREVVLSMGMSDSYECAIEEGSNIVRVGSAIFGSRIYK